MEPVHGIKGPELPDIGKIFQDGIAMLSKLFKGDINKSRSSDTDIELPVRNSEKPQGTSGPKPATNEAASNQQTISNKAKVLSIKNAVCEFFGKAKTQPDDEIALHTLPSFKEPKTQAKEQEPTAQAKQPPPRPAAQLPPKEPMAEAKPQRPAAQLPPALKQPVTEAKQHREPAPTPSTPKKTVDENKLSDGEKEAINVYAKPLPSTPPSKASEAAGAVPKEEAKLADHQEAYTLSPLTPFPTSSERNNIPDRNKLTAAELINPTVFASKMYVMPFTEKAALEQLGAEGYYKPENLLEIEKNILPILDKSKNAKVKDIVTVLKTEINKYKEAERKEAEVLDNYANNIHSNPSASLETLKDCLSKLEKGPNAQDAWHQAAIVNLKNRIAAIDRDNRQPGANS
jgi:hypothetical protein